MHAPIRIAVIAGVRFYRDGLADVLEAEDGLAVISTMSRAPDDLRQLVGTEPDVLLLDVTPADSLDEVRRLLVALSQTRVVALAVMDQEHLVMACAEAGVAGYVTSEQSIEDVVAVVKAVVRGEMICSPRIAAALLRHVGLLASERDVPTPDEEPAARLTPREREIVGLIDRGLSNKQIARDLTIEVATVKNHVHNILEKLHVRRREDAAQWVRSERLDFGAPIHPTLPRI